MDSGNHGRNNLIIPHFGLQNLKHRLIRRTAEPAQELPVVPEIYPQPFRNRKYPLAVRHGVTEGICLCESWIIRFPVVTIARYLGISSPVASITANQGKKYAHKYNNILLNLRP